MWICIVCNICSLLRSARKDLAMFARWRGSSTDLRCVASIVCVLIVVALRDGGIAEARIRNPFVVSAPPNTSSGGTSFLKDMLLAVPSSSEHLSIFSLHASTPTNSGRYNRTEIPLPFNASSWNSDDATAKGFSQITPTVTVVDNQWVVVATQSANLTLFEYRPLTSSNAADPSQTLVLIRTFSFVGYQLVLQPLAVPRLRGDSRDPLVALLTINTASIPSATQQLRILNLATMEWTWQVASPSEEMSSPSTIPMPVFTWYPDAVYIRHSMVGGMAKYSIPRSNFTLGSISSKPQVIWRRSTNNANVSDGSFVRRSAGLVFMNSAPIGTTYRIVVFDDCSGTALGYLSGATALPMVITTVPANGPRLFFAKNHTDRQQGLRCQMGYLNTSKVFGPPLSYKEFARFTTASNTYPIIDLDYQIEVQAHDETCVLIPTGTSIVVMMHGLQPLRLLGIVTIGNNDIIVWSYEQDALGTTSFLNATAVFDNSTLLLHFVDDDGGQSSILFMIDILEGNATHSQINESVVNMQVIEEAASVSFYSHEAHEVIVYRIPSRTDRRPSTIHPVPPLPPMQSLPRQNSTAKTIVLTMVGILVVLAFSSLAYNLLRSRKIDLERTIGQELLISAEDDAFAAKGHPECREGDQWEPAAQTNLPESPAIAAQLSDADESDTNSTSFEANNGDDSESSSPESKGSSQQGKKKKKRKFRTAEVAGALVGTLGIVISQLQFLSLLGVYKLQMPSWFQDFMVAMRFAMLSTKAWLGGALPGQRLDSEFTFIVVGCGLSLFTAGLGILTHGTPTLAYAVGMFMYLVIISATVGPMFCTTAFIFVLCVAVAYACSENSTESATNASAPTSRFHHPIRALMISKPSQLKGQFRRCQAHFFAFFGLSLVYLSANPQGWDWSTYANHGGQYYNGTGMSLGLPVMIVTAWLFADSFGYWVNIRSKITSVLARGMVLTMAVTLIPIMESACDVLICREFNCPPGHVLNPYGALLPNETMKCDHCPAGSNLLQYDTFRSAADPSISCEDGPIRLAAGLLACSVFTSMIGIALLLRRTASTLEAELIVARRMKGQAYRSVHLPDSLLDTFVIENKAWIKAIETKKPLTSVFLSVFTYRTRYWYVVLLTYKLYIVIVTKVVGPYDTWGSIILALLGHLGMLIAGVTVDTYIDRRMRIIANLSAAMNVVNVAFTLAVAFTLKDGESPESTAYKFFSVCIILANIVVAVAPIAIFLIPMVWRLRIDDQKASSVIERRKPRPVSLLRSQPAQYFASSINVSALESQPSNANSDDARSEAPTSSLTATSYGTEQPSSPSLDSTQLSSPESAEPASPTDIERTDAAVQFTGARRATAILSQFLIFSIVLLAAASYFTAVPPAPPYAASLAPQFFASSFILIFRDLNPLWASSFLVPTIAAYIRGAAPVLKSTGGDVPPVPETASQAFPVALYIVCGMMLVISSLLPILRDRVLPEHMRTSWATAIRRCSVGLRLILALIGDVLILIVVEPDADVPNMPAVPVVLSYIVFAFTALLHGIRGTPLVSPRHSQTDRSSGEFPAVAAGFPLHGIPSDAGTTEIFLALKVLVAIFATAPMEGASVGLVICFPILLFHLGPYVVLRLRFLMWIAKWQRLLNSPGFVSTCLAIYFVMAIGFGGDHGARGICAGFAFTAFSALTLAAFVLTVLFTKEWSTTRRLFVSLCLVWQATICCTSLTYQEGGVHGRFLAVVLMSSTAFIMLLLWMGITSRLPPNCASLANCMDDENVRSTELNDDGQQMNEVESSPLRRNITIAQQRRSFEGDSTKRESALNDSLRYGIICVQMATAMLAAVVLLMMIDAYSVSREDLTFFDGNNPYQRSTNMTMGWPLATTAKAGEGFAVNDLTAIFRLGYCVVSSDPGYPITERWLVITTDSPYMFNHARTTSSGYSGLDIRPLCSTQYNEGFRAQYTPMPSDEPRFDLHGCVNATDVCFAAVSGCLLSASNSRLEGDCGDANSIAKSYLW